MLENKKKEEDVVIVGSGLAGSLLGIYLAQKGLSPQIYEFREDMRKASIGAGRSINLALSTRGMSALAEVGILDKIMDIAIPMKGRMLHDVQGDLTFQAYGRKENEVIYSVSRAALNIELMNLAEKETSSLIHFEHKCEKVDFAERKIDFLSPTGKKSVPYDRLIATDGAYSSVRLSLRKSSSLSYEQSYLEHGYKELTIPPTEEGGFRLEKNVLHIWPRGGYMMIALPNLDGSFTCTLFLPYEGENGFESLDTPDKVEKFFQKNFPDALPLIPNLLRDFFQNPVGSLVTVRCDPFSYQGEALLLGDAAHAIVPFFGQGMNCAFEDCSVLAQCWEKYGKWPEVFSAYDQLRKENTDAIADMAIDNFIEMRDHVRDPKFLLQKKVSLLLEEKFPEHFIPKYSLVTFHQVPYIKAQREGIKQKKILDQLCANITEAKDVNYEKAFQLIQDNLGEKL